jgi:hypothetical protein
VSSVGLANNSSKKKSWCYIWFFIIYIFFNFVLYVCILLIIYKHFIVKYKNYLFRLEMIKKSLNT